MFVCLKPRSAETNVPISMRFFNKLKTLQLVFAVKKNCYNLATAVVWPSTTGLPIVLYPLHYLCILPTTKVDHLLKRFQILSLATHIWCVTLLTPYISDSHQKNSNVYQKKPPPKTIFHTNLITSNEINYFCDPVLSAIEITIFLFLDK